jgi:hypothetical protein
MFFVFCQFFRVSDEVLFHGARVLQIPGAGEKPRFAFTSGDFREAFDFPVPFFVFVSFSDSRVRFPLR